MGLLLTLARPSVILSIGDGYVGDVLMQQGLKDPFEFLEGRCDFPRNASVERASSCLEVRTCCFL